MLNFDRVLGYTSRNKVPKVPIDFMYAKKVTQGQNIQFFGSFSKTVSYHYFYVLLDRTKRKFHNILACIFYKLYITLRVAGLTREWHNVIRCPAIDV